MQMNRQQMYDNQLSGEFITDLQGFLHVADANKQNGFFLSVHVVSVRIRRITFSQEPFTSTCFSMVSCPTIIVEPSTEKEGL
jgi:ribosomal protein S27E